MNAQAIRRARTKPQTTRQTKPLIAPSIEAGMVRTGIFVIAFRGPSRSGPEDLLPEFAGTVASR
jgi:hypothetical protein